MSEDEKQLFEQLAMEQMDNLYSRAIRLAKSAKAAEILVQQTYAAAFNAFAQFDKNSDFDKWLNEFLMLFYISSTTIVEYQALRE